ncbi:MAG: DUF3137 domain-containing protein [Alphaproteobacteria bacterium]
MFRDQPDRDAFVNKHYTPYTGQLNRMRWWARVTRVTLYTVTFGGGALVISNIVLILVMKWDYPLEFFAVLFSVLLLGIILITALVLHAPKSQALQILLPPLLARRDNFTLHEALSPLYPTILVKGLLPDYTSTQEHVAITGTHDGKAYSISVIHSRNKDNRQRSFKGVVARIDNVSPVSGTFGLHPKSLAGAAWPRIHLESPEFEKKYDFYGTDQVAGRKLMTPNVMNEFTRLDKLLRPKTLHVVFDEDSLFLALQSEHTPFSDTIAQGNVSDLNILATDLERELDHIFATIDAVCQRRARPIEAAHNAGSVL